MEPTSISLSSHLGERLRQLREQQDLRQEDIAAVSRSWGLSWTRATVAAIELGRRKLAAEELLLLPWLAAAMGPDDVKRGARVEALVTWLAGSGRVAVTPLISATADALRGLFEGGPATIGLTFSDPREREKHWDQNWRRIHFLSPPPGGDVAWSRNLAIYTAAGGELERTVARRLGIDALVVAEAAFKKWDRSLTEERNQRVAAQAPPDAPQRAVQALRGHVTRLLLQEIESDLVQVRRRARKKRGRSR